MRFAFSVFEDEDPELVAELAPLGRYERGRRIRALLRAAMDLERGSVPRPGVIPNGATSPAAPAPSAVGILDFDPELFTFRKDTVCP